ncbi:Calponin homology domain [Pseudocohnilembus persalinus]|uniref:Calponin homology domain n=1 Tax=Pseudocohnilembus persalinus TaxID=266149 RepID=A0A0V0QYT0_PSEPJ|nr:Calponin homology domain [Pseudocohnilembus persalinus]|eukprot:KRX07513.1 Calponin homology domain [Pseudocohnilembus persalinus]
MNENFGIMDQAYFTPKKEILEWINNLLQTNCQKIESLGAGNIYLQILDSMDKENRIPMHKVNFKAKLEYEFLQNLKLLQNCFAKFGLKKHIEVEKLSKCKYQDNLEMIQWMKRLFDVNGQAVQDYDPVARRKGQEIDLQFANKTVQPKIFIPTQQQQSQPKSSVTKDKENNSQTMNKRKTDNLMSNPSQVTQKTQQKLIKNDLQDVKQQQQFFEKQIQKQVESLQVDLLDKNHKLQKIKNIVVKSATSDTQKIHEIAAVLGLENILKATQQQEQELLKQQQELLQQQQQYLNQQQQEQQEEDQDQQQQYEQEEQVQQQIKENMVQMENLELNQNQHDDDIL